MAIVEILVLVELLVHVCCLGYGVVIKVSFFLCSMNIKIEFIDVFRILAFHYIDSLGHASTSHNLDSL